MMPEPDRKVVRFCQFNEELAPLVLLGRDALRDLGILAITKPSQSVLFSQAIFDTT
jgi:hypothetical protein